MEHQVGAKVLLSPCSSEGLSAFWMLSKHYFEDIVLKNVPSVLVTSVLFLAKWAAYLLFFISEAFSIQGPSLGSRKFP